MPACVNQLSKRVLTMVTDSSKVEMLLESGSENPKRVFSALNVELTKPLTDKVFTPEEAHAFIRERYEKLSPEDIDMALGFLNSEMGSKQRKLSAEFSTICSELLKGTILIEKASAEKAKQVEEFFRAAGALDALAAIPKPADPKPRDLMYSYVVDFYADRLSDAELEELIAHYTSSEGRKAANAALELTRDILQVYGIN